MGESVHRSEVYGRRLYLVLQAFLKGYVADISCIKKVPEPILHPNYRNLLIYKLELTRRVQVSAGAAVYIY